MPTPEHTLLISLQADWWTISGWIVGALGTALSIQQALKARSLKRELRSFGWREIHAGGQALADRIKRQGTPAALVATDSRGGIIAKVIADRLSADVPVIVGTSFDRQDAPPAALPGYICIDTERWRYFLPEAIRFYQNRMIVVVDDVVFTGESMRTVKNTLNREGVAMVSTAALLCSHVADRSRSAPDFIWAKTEHSEVYFPWGRMR